VATPSPDALAAALRRGDPPVVGRILDGQLLLDPRTVPPGMDDVLLRAVHAAWGRTKKDE
jgi:L-seryl-tRNA(Ser) seleniumtransferase